MDSQILPFINEFISLLSKSISESNPSYRLTKSQERWLSFCLTGILLTNTICWTRFEKASFGSKKIAALSWMFRHSKINWDVLLQQSVASILIKYGLLSGSLLVDDTDKERSKNAKKIYKIGKQKDKKSGGYFMGQSIIILMLVTDKVSIPVGFKFYQKDPELKAWEKRDEALRKKGIAKKDRPEKPPKNPAYPSKNEIAVELIKQFKDSFGHIDIKSVNADALYGTSTFIEGITSLYSSDIQVTTQIRKNQNIKIDGEELNVSDYFKNQIPTKTQITIRGGKKQTVYYCSVVAVVSAQGKKRLIIALKYEGETNYRYIIAQNMTWRVQDVLECYSLRWLVEVFNQDWKMYEAWGQLTKHTGEEGSRRTLILSLLFDHCLLSHPLQAARVKDKLPLFSVGSLRDRLCAESLLQFFKYLLEQANPEKYLEQLTQNILEVYPLRLSTKHMSGRTANFGPT